MQHPLRNVRFHEGDFDDEFRSVHLRHAGRGPPGSEDKDLSKMSLADVEANLGVNAAQGLSADEVKDRLTKYGPNALAEKETSLARQILGYFTGPIAYMIEAAATGLGDPRPLAGLRHHRGPAALQRRARLLAGPQGLERARGAEEGAGARGDRAARRRLGDRRRREPGAGRHRQDPPRRHRAGRPAPRVRRTSPPSTSRR